MEQMIRIGIRKGEEMQAQAVTVAKPPPPLTNDEMKIKVREVTSTVDFSSLAYISEGYSAGAIARTIRSVVTTRRVSSAKKRPLTNVDFLDNLSLQIVSFHDDKLAFLAFTRAITGIDDRRKKIEAMVAGDDDDKKGGDKKKK